MRKFFLSIIGITILFINQSFGETISTPTQGIAIGALYTFEDGSRGVIFYMDGEHGLVVSLKGSKAKWCSGKFARMDIPEVPNACDAIPRITKIGEGAYYSKCILNSTNSPAVN